MGFSHAGFFVCVTVRRCVQLVLRLLMRHALRPRTAAPSGPHDNAAFRAAALHGNLHLLRKN